MKIIINILIFVCLIEAWMIRDSNRDLNATLEREKYWKELCFHDVERFEKENNKK